MSISIIFVQCKLCGFKTSNGNMESNHKIEESIKAIRGSQRVKEIALLLHEKTVLNSDEFADLFDGLMQLMGYKEKFQIVNCFEVLQEFIG